MGVCREKYSLQRKQDVGRKKKNDNLIILLSLCWNKRISLIHLRCVGYRQWVKFRNFYPFATDTRTSWKEAKREKKKSRNTPFLRIHVIEKGMFYVQRHRVAPKNTPTD